MNNPCPTCNSEFGRVKGRCPTCGFDYDINLSDICATREDGTMGPDAQAATRWREKYEEVREKMKGERDQLIIMLRDLLAIEDPTTPESHAIFVRAEELLSSLGEAQ